MGNMDVLSKHGSFKPYYNWNTFNTVNGDMKNRLFGVLNLIITGIPSILKNSNVVKNVVIGFKPYYNWNTFNTFIKIIL